MTAMWFLNSLATALLLASSQRQGVVVNGFSFLPSAKVFQRMAFSSPMDLRMVSAATSRVEQPSFEGSGSGSGDAREREPRVAEFVNLEPVAETDARKARLWRDEETKQLFCKYGDELWELRKKMQTLAEKINTSSSSRRQDQVQIRQELREMERRDPELVYELELLEMELARRDGNMQQAEKSKHKALSARSCLPQYNLEGLWVGKYGNHGYEMINVTYAGDTLIAYKVTGDKNVPRGEVTFQADLTPSIVRNLRDGGGKSGKMTTKDSLSLQKPLDPIMLTEKAAGKWGTRQLPRYRGLGQVAEPGFTNNKWMDGQLIIIGEEYFSFAWVPLENQIFFGRPSPELALKMLREGGKEDLRIKTHWEAPPSLDDDVDVLKRFVASCLEKSAITHEEELPAGDPFSCIWHGHGDTEECYFE